jgi:hypothetical protein
VEKLRKNQEIIVEKVIDISAGKSYPFMWRRLTEGSPKIRKG